METASCGERRRLLCSIGTCEISLLNLNENPVQYLFVPNCGREAGTLRSAEYTVGQVNEDLDRLTKTTEREERERILQSMIVKTTPRQMKWIIQILLRNLKVNYFFVSLFESTGSLDCRKWSCFLIFIKMRGNFTIRRWIWKKCVVFLKMKTSGIKSRYVKKTECLSIRNVGH